jgi:nucleoside-diphosphate-sugar epimerase
MEPEVAEPGRILVTGATGFIGGHLAQRLHAQGQQLRLLARDPSRLAPELVRHCEIVIGDLRQPQTLPAAVEQVELIFHCAANVRTWDRRTEYFASNVAGLEHLLRAIEASGHRPRRFVHLSSVDVYGFPKLPASEESPMRSRGYGYGDSKIAAENVLVQQVRRMGLDTVILRPCNVMGPGSPFISRIGAELASGLMLKIDGGHYDCGYTPIDTLIDVLLWAADAANASGRIFNVCGMEKVSWGRFLDDFRQAIGGRGLIWNLPRPLALGAAQVLQAPYRLLGLRSEPLLHPLIVDIFGRTCGHATAALQQAGAPLAGTSYTDSLRASLDWFLAQAASQ